MKKLNCILLIDDNPGDNYIHKRAILKADVCDHVEVAVGGKEALDYLKNGGVGPYPKPELIFLDINMPGMSGFEFLEEYSKLDEKFKSKTIVFMLTSSLLPEDTERAMNSGEISEFLNKPLNVDKVREIIARFF